MSMEVYDEKSDHDNPFVEPLFSLNIHKAKIKRSSDLKEMYYSRISSSSSRSLSIILLKISVKTKVLKFCIEAINEEEIQDWLERLGKPALRNQND